MKPIIIGMVAFIAMVTAVLMTMESPKESVPVKIVPIKNVKEMTFKELLAISPHAVQRAYEEMKAAGKAAEAATAEAQADPTTATLAEAMVAGHHWSATIKQYEYEMREWERQTRWALKDLKGSKK